MAEKISLDHDYRKLPSIPEETDLATNAIGMVPQNSQLNSKLQFCVPQRTSILIPIRMTCEKIGHPNFAYNAYYASISDRLQETLFEVA